jgi:hypothetical protein
MAEETGGTYRLEYVRCGKDNCTRCAGGPAHGPYWYVYYRRNGKVVSKYVGKDRSGGGGGLAPAGNASAAAPPEPAGPAPASGTMSARPRTPNRWGTFASADYPVNFHEDGVIGTALAQMGSDAMLDVDGESLADALGKAATDAVVGRASAQQLVDRVRELRDRLPQGGAARRELDQAVSKLDAPAAPPPAVPPVTLGPLRQLADELHAVPLVRRDPGKEGQALARILDDFAAGRTGGARLIMAVRELRNRRHESAEGKFEISTGPSTRP